MTEIEWSKWTEPVSRQRDYPDLFESLDLSLPQMAAVRRAVEQGDWPTAEKAFVAAESMIRRVATKGVIHKRAADRAISRLASRLNELRSSK